MSVNRYLLIDLGNTRKHLSLVQGLIKKIHHFETLPEMLVFLENMKAPWLDAKVLISSVLSKKETFAFIKNLKRAGLGPILRLRGLVASLLRSQYDWESLGEDRIAAIAYGVLMKKAPCVLIDAGTAITIDVLSSKNSHDGGYILPSLGLDLAALYKNTSSLPHLSKNMRLSRALPKTTVLAIQNGVLKAKLGGIQFILREIFQKVPEINSERVYFTGGDGKKLSSLLKVGKYVDLLLLEGMRLSLEETQRDTKGLI